MIIIVKGKARTSLGMCLMLWLIIKKILIKIYSFFEILQVKSISDELGLIGSRSLRRLYWEILDIIKHYSFGFIFFLVSRSYDTHVDYFWYTFGNFFKSFHNQMSRCAFKHLHSKLYNTEIKHVC